MKRFKDLSALVGVLNKIYELKPGIEGRKIFSAALEQHFELITNQAELFAESVLTKNSEVSAQCVKENGWKIQGRWKHLEQQGNPSAYMSTSSETWVFRDNLTYEHKYETYKEYVDPFGFSYSGFPKNDPEIGQWAPSDSSDDVFKIVLVTSTGSTKQLTIAKVVDHQYDHSCKIDNVHFIFD
jgi:hypothetical protein